MRILLINNLHRRRGGADIVYLNTGQLLKEAGHEVYYYSINSEGQDPCEQEKFFAPSLKSFSKPRAAINYFYNKSAANSLDMLLYQIKPDIACVHLVWGGLTASIFQTLHQHHVPIVHVVHDYRMICPAYTCRRFDNTVCEECKGGHYMSCFTYKCSKGKTIQSLMMAIEMYYRQIWHNPINEIDGFVFVSQFCKNKHIEFEPLFGQVRSIVLYNTARIIAPKPIRGGYYLYYGRLSYEKGVTTLLQTASILKDLTFKIVGTGPLEQWIRETICQKGLNNVELDGYKTGKELSDIIGSSKYVVVPSEWYENNPMTIVEAYSMGVPVIGADIGGIPEVIKHESTGFVFRSGDFVSLTDIIKQSSSLSEEEYRTMCNNSLAFAKRHFNQEKYVEKLLAFLSEIKNMYLMK